MQMRPLLTLLSGSHFIKTAQKYAQAQMTSNVAIACSLTFISMQLIEINLLE